MRICVLCVLPNTTFMSSDFLIELFTNHLLLPVMLKDHPDYLNQDGFFVPFFLALPPSLSNHSLFTLYCSSSFQIHRLLFQPLPHVI